MFDNGNNKVWDEVLLIIRTRLQRSVNDNISFKPVYNISMHNCKR